MFNSVGENKPPTTHAHQREQQHQEQTTSDSSSSMVVKTVGENKFFPSFSTSLPPPIVYGELSILGYNGYIPNVERNGRRNRSKFLLCKRPAPNGIKKSRHYIVKQSPQTTKAIQDKDLHSISYTFSRSQTIIVEYRQDESTDMFQIGRSSEDPIDFVVMDTLAAHVADISSNNHRHNQSSRHAHSENSSSSNQQIMAGDLVSGINRIHRHLAKVDDELSLHFGAPQPPHNDTRSRLQHDHRQHQAQAVLLNYPQPNISNLPPMMADHFRNHDSSAYHHGHSSGSQQHQHLPHTGASRVSANGNHHYHHNQNNNNSSEQHEHCSSRHNLICKRSHATQSTISRFACRILVDRKLPYTARIYAAGFDSSKNIFLGEKATKWEQNDTIDGLTTNGVLLMHPKQDQKQDDSTGGGVWREVSVDGGIYAIRESRSAPQKGTRIEDETNILQDGTLIDLCGATLLWRSVDGFRASPTKKSLEEKIDMLNASRPQCPVGLNTLVIPRKPIIPTNHQHRVTSKDNHHHGIKDSDKTSHQPYVYLKCGHVQGYHDWGTTEKSNHRTCPICLSVGAVAKLSMGLEPSYYVDSGPLTHVFNPCGHMASENTVKYWCSIKIPHGTHFFHSICPFCAASLATNDPGYTKLIFQDDLD